MTNGRQLFFNIVIYINYIYLHMYIINYYIEIYSKPVTFKNLFVYKKKTFKLNYLTNKITNVKLSKISSKTLIISVIV